MFTPNCSAPMNRLLNRSLYFIQALFRARYESSQVFAHILMQETKVALTLSVQSTSVGKPHSRSQHGVAKSAKRWPTKGLSSDTIMIPSHLTALHVGFMCDSCVRGFQYWFNASVFPHSHFQLGSHKINKNNCLLENVSYWLSCPFKFKAFIRGLTGSSNLNMAWLLVQYPLV